MIHAQFRITCQQQAWTNSKPAHLNPANWTPSTAPQHASPSKIGPKLLVHKASCPSRTRSCVRTYTTHLHGRTFLPPTASLESTHARHRRGFRARPSQHFAGPPVGMCCHCCVQAEQQHSCRSSRGAVNTAVQALKPSLCALRRFVPAHGCKCALQDTRGVPACRQPMSQRTTAVPSAAVLESVRRSTP
jgi:hypothetical protein